MRIQTGRNTIAAILCFVFFSPAAYSQPPYHIRIYTNNDGLPVNGLKGIEYDPATQLLWIGTEAGLVKFDGHSFQTISADNRLNPARRIFSVYKNNTGNIECLTQDNAVYNIRNGRPVFTGTDSLLIIAATIMTNSLTMAVLPLLDSTTSGMNEAILMPWFTYTDTMKTGFVFFHRKNVFHYNRQNHSLQLLASGVEEFGSFSGNGILFLNINNRLYQFNRLTRKLDAVIIRNGPPHGATKPDYIITNTNTSYPLLQHRDELWQLYYDGHEFTAKLLCKELPFPGTKLIARATDDNTIILADSYKGLYILQKNSLASIHTLALTPDQPFVSYGQAELRPNMIINQGGIVINEKGMQIKNEKKVASIFNYYSRGDELWYNRFDTVRCYNKNTGFVKNFLLRDSSFLTAFAETGGNLYAINKVGIYLLADGALSLQNRHAKGSGISKDNAINFDAIEFSPSVLAVTGLKEIIFYNVKEKKITTQAVSRQARLRALWKYKEYLFIGTYGEGIFGLKNGILKALPLDKGRLLSYSHCFMPDDSGFCWISTNNGLFKVSIAALCEAYDKDLPEIYYHHFGKEDGMTNTELNGGCQPCALKLQNGTFSFPAMNGLVWFHPANAVAKPPSGPILINQVEIDAGMYAQDDTLLSNIPSSFKNISFYFTIPCWGNMENLYTAYRLKNFDDKWKTFTIEKQHSISYNSLPPGAYIFEIRMLTGFLASQYKIVSLPFTVLTPWYFRWWSFMLAALLLLLIIWATVKWQTLRIRKRNIALEKQVLHRTSEIEEKNNLLKEQVQKLKVYGEELTLNNKVKTRLISIISHNIISPLQFMYRASLTLRQQPNRLPLHLHQKATESLAETAKELELLAINMLNWIRFQHQNYDSFPTSFEAGTVLNHVVTLTEPMAKEKGLLLQQQIRQPLLCLQYRDAVQVILYNLVMNAINYSASGTITQSIQKKKELFELAVTDEGEGMPPEKVKALTTLQLLISDDKLPGMNGQGFGYLIIADLLRLIKGQICIESEPGKGTTVIVQFSSLGEVSV